ncbi:dephospho-CoA kinase [soil metagenome]
MTSPDSHAVKHQKWLPKVVGLTGGIGGGKSTARRIFEELGVPCRDADHVAREIHQDPQHPATSLLAAAFPDATTPEGKLKRGSMCKVFALNDASNRELRRILKPFVMADLLRWAAAQSAPYVIWESALIIEEKIPTDRMLVIDASDDLRVARVRIRNPDWSLEHIERLLAIQLPRASYVTSAHDFVQNEASYEAFKMKIEALHQVYRQMWS